jgi:hypothetical protein
MLAHARVVIPLAGLLLATPGFVGCDKKPKPTAQAAEAPAPAPDTSRNAAPVYAALYDRLGNEFFDSLFPYGQEKPVDPAILKAHKADIDELIAATRLPDCDFGVNVVDWETPMPHLPKVRKLYKLLDADAKRCLAEANPVAAGARAAAVLRMAHHLTLHSHIIMEVLVAESMADGTIKLLNERIDPGMLPDQVRAEVKDALASLDTPDLLNSKQTVLADLDLAVRSLRAGKLSKDLEGNTFSQADQDRAATEVEAAIKKLPGAWDGPDPQSALAGLSSGASRAAQAELSMLPRTWKSISDFKVRLTAARKKFGP